MSQVMEHVRQLAEVIGPRPACTDAEASAADYIEDVFRARGLEVERQEFDSPRTYARAHAVLSALVIVAAVLSIWFPLPALALAAVGAVLLWLDLSTRFSLAPLLGKGPTQNIIARHVPRQRRGERLKRVVIIAHYDSAKSTFIDGPGAVRNLRLGISLMRWIPVGVVVTIMFAVLPFAAEWSPWTGYATCLVAAYMLVPLMVSLQRDLFGHATDGANDNASGVAAMFGVMEATVPEADEVIFHDRPHRRSAEVAFEAGVVPEDALLEYRQTDAVPTASGASAFDGFGDVDWETGRLEPVRETAAECEPRPAAAPAGDWTEEAGVGALFEEPEPRPAVSAAWRETRATRPAPSPVPANFDGTVQRVADEDVAEGQERFAFGDDSGSDAADESGREGHGISAWLGIGRGFDVRKAGKKIGSWENLDTDDDDDFGIKGGSAGDLGSDADVPSDVASRIRRRVTENVDRALVEKEIWFVATGADEAGGWGTRALLEEFADDLRDALIINIDGVGSGALSVLTDEGVTRTLHSDRRLVAQAKRTARENEMTVKTRSYRGLPTTVTAGLARRFKAMTVMAFDINGRRPNWHWHTDTVENVTEATVEQAVAFVTALVRDL